MQHPLEFIPVPYRKGLFVTFLFLTIAFFVVFGVLDTPLLPNGVVSFELASTPEKADTIVSSWSSEGTLYAAFGLGIDYLFMPIYSLALAFGALLAAGRHSGWVKSLGAAAGWGAFAAALFDAVENFALFQILLGSIHSPYPEIAAICATIKFALLIVGLMYAVVAALLPRYS